MNNERGWEVEFCLRVKFACAYLDMANKQGQARRFLEAVYCGEVELDQWTRKMAGKVAQGAEALVAEHGQPSTSVPIAAQGYVERLRQAGLFLSAPSAGTTKID